MQKDSRVIKTSAPPVSQINAEYVTQVSYDYFISISQTCLCINVCVFSLKLSNKYWAPHVKSKLPFDPQVRLWALILLSFSLHDVTLQNKYRDYSKYIDPEDMLLYAGVTLVLCMHGQSCVFNLLKLYSGCGLWMLNISHFQVVEDIYQNEILKSK